MSRSNPFEEIEQFFDRTPFSGDRMWGRDWRGADVDIADYDDEFVVMADLPGYDREDIELHATDGQLTIHAERDTVDQDSDRQYLRRERRQESVTRTIDLPGAVVEAEASATYTNGVLTVTLPKEFTEDDDGHRIDVQ